MIIDFKPDRSYQLPAPNAAPQTTPISINSPLGNYPELNRQVENLKYFHDWDDTTTALLSMVAEKLCLEGAALSSYSDNDRALAEIATFDWQKNFRDAPEYLQKFSRRVALIVEQAPGDYCAVLPCASTSTAAAPMATQAQDSHSAATRLLSNLAWNVIGKVTERICIKAIPIPQLPIFIDGYKDLQSIYFGNYSSQRKLEELGVVLERLSRKLSEYPKKHKEFRGYLDAVLPWLKSVNTQWVALESGIHDLNDNQSALGKVISLVEMTEKFLFDPQLKNTLGEDNVESLTQSLRAMKQTLSQVQLWQALPNEASLDDYLGILASSPVALQVLDESTLKLSQALALVQKTTPYPRNGSLSSRLSWLTTTLSNTALREHLQPHVEMLLGSKQQADQLFAVFQFADQLRRFPVDSSLGGQALWLLNSLDRCAGASSALQWINQFQSALGADPATVTLLNRLLTLKQKPESLRLLVQDIAKAAAPSVGSLAVDYIARQILPVPMVRELEKFYQESTATESWTSMCQRMYQRMKTGAWEITNSYLIDKLSGNPLAAATMRYANAIQTHTSWKETLEWFVKQDQSEGKTAQFAYSQYLNAMLIWQVYQAFNSNDPDETKGTLHQLACSLNDLQVVKSYPQLEKLIDLIPLLPALRDAQNVVQAQPSADSWLAWSNHWLDALANSNDQSLRELRDQLARRVENWLADALMSAFDSIATRPWGLLPAAAADQSTLKGPTQNEVGLTDWMAIGTEASVLPKGGNQAATPVSTSQATTVERIGVTPPSGHGADLQLLAGITLEAAGLAAIGYALWRWRQASKPAPTQDIEMTEVLVESSRASMVDETSPFRPSASSPAATESGLWKQKRPLLLGIAMLAGGVVLYGRAKQDHQPPSRISAEEYAQEIAIIKGLKVDDLSEIFAADVAGESRVRVKRSPEAENDNIPNQMLGILHMEEIDWRIRNEFDQILRRAEATPEVKAAPNKSEKNIRLLIKCIQFTREFLKANESQHRHNLSYESGQKVLQELWRVADGLQNTHSQFVVRQYKQAYPVGGPARQAVASQAVLAARKELDFTKYEDSVAAKLTELWNADAAPFEPQMSFERERNQCLVRFHQRLQEFIDNEITAQDSLIRNGEGNNSRLNTSIVMIAGVMAAADQVLDLLPRNKETTAYLDSLAQTSAAHARLAKLKQAFEVSDIADETYFAQRQAWQNTDQSEATFLSEATLSASAQRWRQAIVEEESDFFSLIDNDPSRQAFDGLPALFEGVFKRRMGELGQQIYRLLAAELPWTELKHECEAEIELLQMKKFHLANLLIDEMQSYGICKGLSAYGDLRGKYDGDQAIFEAKKIAVELLIQQYGDAEEQLDSDDKIIAFSQVRNHPDISGEVKSYLLMAAALAYRKMTDNAAGLDYMRWSPKLFVDYKEKNTDYFKRLYEATPAEYKGMDTFKKSGNTEALADYYNQFVDYKKNSIDFDARKLSYGTLIGLGLTDYEISKMKPERIVYGNLYVFFEINEKLVLLLESGGDRRLNDKYESNLGSATPIPGTIGFVPLRDGRIVAISGLNLKLNAKIFSKSEVGASRALQKIKNAETRGFKALSFNDVMPELEGKDLIDSVLRPLLGEELNEVLTKRKSHGFPILLGPKIIQQHPRAGREMLDVTDEVVKTNLTQWVGLLKEAYKDRNFWTFVLDLLPFYTQIRDSIADPEHRLDINSITWDVVGIIASILPAIGSIGKLGSSGQAILKQAILANLEKKLTGKALTIGILRTLSKDPEFTKLGLKGLAYAVYAGADAISPISLELVTTPILHGSKNIRQWLHKPPANPGRGSENAQQAQSLAQTEFEKLGKNTPLLVADHKPLNLRSSLISPGEVIEECNALFQPLGRKQPVLRRAGKAAPYEKIDACIPESRGNRSKRGILRDLLAACLPANRSNPELETPLAVAPPPIEPRRIIEGSPSSDLPVEMRSYLIELRADPKINGRMLRPAENCEAILPDVAKFMKEKGFENIQYRGMFIWNNALDTMPSTHFVAIGNKHSEAFVFDLTAAQFADKGMPSLSEPLILPEAAWARRYQSAATTKLMKYKDFDNISDARIAFGSTQRPATTDVIDGAYILAEPQRRGGAVNKGTRQQMQATGSESDDLASSSRIVPVSEIDQKMIGRLVKSITGSDQARALANLTDRSTVERSIRQNLTRDFEGKLKNRFAWGSFATEKANAQRRLDSDLTRLMQVEDHMSQLLAHPPAVLREAVSGAPEEAAARWIAGNSRSAKTAAEAQELTARVQDALTRHRHADLLDIRTIESLHDAVYKPAAGQFPRTFRSSSDPVFMGSDIARAGFEKALTQIKAKPVTDHMALADALYAATVRYHPFGDGNGRTARAIYALAQLQKGEQSFMALSKAAEDILNPPGPLGRPRPVPSDAQTPAQAGTSGVGAGRALSPKPVKPKLKDFEGKDAEFEEAMKKYLADKGTRTRMEAAGSGFDDLASRRRKAVGQLEQYQIDRPELFEKLRTKSSANFTLTSIDGDPAETLVLSAHGWYTRDSRNALLPTGKDLVFLGPHDEVLLEPPSSAAFLPTQKLLDGAEYPTIYSLLRNQASVGRQNHSEFTHLNAGVDKVNWVKNYHIKHYEKMPEEEAKLAILHNRASGSQSKMDLLTVNEMAGNNKTLKDVLEEMKPGGMYSDYKQLVFAACREEKMPGTLIPVKVGLGLGYEIKFTKTPLQQQAASALRHRRDLDAATQATEERPFDGYWVYEVVTLTPSDDIFRAYHETCEILPYVLAQRPERTLSR